MDKNESFAGHYRALELDKILERAAQLTSCEDAKIKMMSLEPSKKLDKVNALLKETSDAHSLSGRFGSPSFGGLCNITDSLKRAKTGSSLSTTELLQTARVLHVIRTLKDWRKRAQAGSTVLDIYFDTLLPSRYVEDKITSSILSEDEITVVIDMDEGNKNATAWGCDLTFDYVKINADYRS